MTAVPVEQALRWTAPLTRRSWTAGPGRPAGLPASRSVRRYLDHLAVERGRRRRTRWPRTAGTCAATRRTWRRRRPALGAVAEPIVAGFLRRAARGRRRAPAAVGVLGGPGAGRGARPAPVRRPGGIVADDVARDGAATGAAAAAAEGDLASTRSSGCSRRPASTGRRSRCATGRCWSCCTAPAPGSPRRSASTSTTSTSTPRAVRLRGKGGKQRLVPVGSYALRGGRRLPGPGRPALRRRPGAGTPALFLNARGGRLSRQSAWTVLRVAAERAGLTADGVAAHAAALVRHPPARRGSGRPGGPGAARARVGDHDPGLHAGHRGPAARGVRDRAPAGALTLAGSRPQGAPRSSTGDRPPSTAVHRGAPGCPQLRPGRLSRPRDRHTVAAPSA